MKKTRSTPRLPSFLSTFLVTATFFLGAAHGENAIVKWQGNYMADGYTGNLYLNRGSEATLPDGKIFPDLTTEKSPASPRYDRTAPSAAFFGTLQTTSSQPVSTERSRMQVRYEGGENHIAFSSDPGEQGNTVSVRGLIFWPDTEFLGEYVGAPLRSLSEIGRMALNVTDVRGEAEVRFAVRSEGRWYFSQQNLTARSSGPEPTSPGTLTLADPGKNPWGLWTTENGKLPLADSPTSYEVNPSSLKNITAIGFYFSATYSASNAALFELSEFTATGN